MSEIIEISKLEAANRQLVCAIRMVFEEKDPIVIHTLAGAASILFSDLVEILKPEFSWDRMAQEDSALDAKEYFRIARKAQNFLKHAKNDHEGKLQFDPNETEALIMMAVMNASEIAIMPIEFQVFQLWFLAGKYPEDCKEKEPFKSAVSIFGDLRVVSRAERIKAGQLVMERSLNEKI